MKKYKLLWIILAIILIIYIGYLIIDSIRLRNAKIGTKPVITITEENTENRLTYTGLGYTISYYKDINKTKETGIELIEHLGYGAEFKLFGKILIWAWIE